MTRKPEISMTACKSSAIASHGYDSETRTLALRYQTGKTYRYVDVPPETYEKLKAAKSIGGFVAGYVVGKFKAGN